MRSKLFQTLSEKGRKSPEREPELYHQSLTGRPLRVHHPIPTSSGLPELHCLHHFPHTTPPYIREPGNPRSL